MLVAARVKLSRISNPPTYNIALEFNAQKITHVNRTAIDHRLFIFGRHAFSRRTRQATKREHGVWEAYVSTPPEAEHPIF